VWTFFLRQEDRSLWIRDPGGKRGLRHNGGGPFFFSDKTRPYEKTAESSMSTFPVRGDLLDSEDEWTSP